tara:strand:- start:3798 stop:4082 length:285 start_codon:yes stop_codon:yes gene_type:complete
MRLLLVLPILLLSTAPAMAITPEECRTALDALLNEIETNRGYAEDIYRESLKTADTDYEREVWQAEIDKIYDQEERERGRADHMWRDCMAAAEG